jgi:response regulator RpfG family c-di-GMP phosphodiesterase
MRRYANAMSLSEAMGGIRAGRERQLSPVVVDAFWKVAMDHPAAVLPREELTTAIALI